MNLRKMVKATTIALASVATVALAIAPMKAFAADATVDGFALNVKNGTTLELSETDKTTLVESLPEWFAYPGAPNIATDVFVMNDESQLSVDWENSTVTKDDIVYSETTVLALNYNEAGEVVFSDWGLISDCLIFEEENGEKTYMMEQSIGGNDAWNFFYEEAEVGVYSETYNILSKIGEFHWQGIAGECDAVENPTDQKNYVFALRVKTSDDANSLFLLVPEDSYFYEGLAKKTPEQDTSYEVELPKDNTAISSTDFSAVITQNATKDVVIESNENVTFTFAKGTMSAVDGMTSYDFGTKVVADFANAGTMTSSVTKDIFVSRVNFNYSGKLPGTASIKILVGTEYAGKTLYYSKLTENSFTYITSGVVDAQGYVTVSQDSCSDYVLTTEKLTETSSIPNLGNNNMVFVGCAFVVMGIAFVLVGFKNKKMA